MTFRASPAHVRTARLVAVTVARRAGLPEDVVEAVRQGVGEACALALRAAAAGGDVTVELDDAGPGLTARVWPVDSGGRAEPAAHLDEDALPHAVLAGLTGENGLEQGDGHSVLRLHWSQ